MSAQLFAVKRAAILAAVLGCNGSGEVDASTDAPSDSPVDASAYDSCDPKPVFDGNVGSDDCGITDSGGIDLECGTSGPPGHLNCYTDLGGDAVAYNCSGSVCCTLKGECYSPSQEPNFCDRPYCPN